MFYHPGTYALPFQCSSLAAPLASTEYYLGDFNNPPITSATFFKIWIPKNATIRGAQVQIYTSGALSSGEAATFNVRLNNATDYAIGTSPMAANREHISNTALYIPVIVGDYVEIHISTPGWVSAPAGVQISGMLLLECPK